MAVGLCPLSWCICWMPRYDEGCRYMALWKPEMMTIAFSLWHSKMVHSLQEVSSSLWTLKKFCHLLMQQRDYWVKGQALPSLFVLRRLWVIVPSTAPMMPSAGSRYFLSSASSTPGALKCELEELYHVCFGEVQALAGGTWGNLDHHSRSRWWFPGRQVSKFW